MAMPVEGPTGEALKPASITGKIEFRSVSFRYPGAAEKALNGVSFTINPGEHVALLGPVGSGKSTIARLILGLYPADDGLVLIDGTDVRQFEPAQLRRQHRRGPAGERAVLRLGAREHRARRRGDRRSRADPRGRRFPGTHQFMGQIANGYDLRLADRGEGLSGGQRQSIAIARALAGRPPILVFDEPTSAMDTQTEDALIQRLQAEAADKTLVVITHRPSHAQAGQADHHRRGAAGSSPTARATRSSSASPGRRRPEHGGHDEKPTDSPHLEDLADRIRPRAASNLLLWAILGFVAIFLIWAALDRARPHRARAGPDHRQLAAAGRVEPRGRHRRCDPRAHRAAGSRGAGTRPAQPHAVRRRVRQRPGDARRAARQDRPPRSRGRRPQPRYPAAADAAMATQVAIERSLHEARMANLSAINAAAQARLVQAQRAATEAAAAYQARVSARDAARIELAAIRPLVERGIEPQLSLVRAESAAAVAASEASAASAAVARAQAGVAEARSMLAQQQQDWRSQAANELAAARGELAARQRALPALADRVERTDVRSPLAGRVNRVLVTTVGGSVGPGAPLVEIVPDRGDAAGRGDGPAEGHRQRPHRPAGQGRHLRLRSRGLRFADRPRFGDLARCGRRTSGPARPSTSSRSAPTAIAPAPGASCAIGTGMIADVSLLGDKRSVLSYLLSPITRLSERAFRE